MIRMLAARGFPLGAAEVRQLAGQFSILNNLNLFKKTVAGYYWFVGFMERHRDLRLKKPEVLSKSLKPKRKTSTAKSSASAGSICPVCRVKEHSIKDVLPWIQCHVCETWYHEPCGEKCGLLDDDNFTCRRCVVTVS
jgi:hypothetical protein